MKITDKRLIEIAARTAEDIMGIRCPTNERLWHPKGKCGTCDVARHVLDAIDAAIKQETKSRALKGEKLKGGA